MSFKVGLSKSYKITVLLQLERCLLILLPFYFTALEARTKNLYTGKPLHKQSVLHLRGPERFLPSLQLLAKCKICKI